TITAESFAGMFMGDGSGITGVSATSVGTLTGVSPLALEGENVDDFQTTLQVEEPVSDQVIVIPNSSGTIITTGNDNLIDAVGTVNTGSWQAGVIQDTYVSDYLTISDGSINGVNIGSTVPDSGRFIDLTAVNGISLGDGLIKISPEEMGYLDDAMPGTIAENKAIVLDRDLSITGLKSITLSEDFFSALVGVDNIIIDDSNIGPVDDTNLMTLSNGTVTVDGTLAATTLTGDGSG
ncbi:uncharacterized protein METZ01_LOCUS496142, partial [marine metagenome]